MSTASHSSCEFFLGDLRKSKLVDRGQIDLLIPPFLRQHPRAEPAQLADYLISKGLLNEFQAKRLLGGNADLMMGSYVLVNEIGATNLGTMFQAVSRKDDQPYALQVIPRRSMFDASKARRIARSFEQCKHPGVVPFVDVGNEGNFHYLVWPLAEGETIDKLVARSGPLDPGRAAYYAEQVADALDVCHQVGLTHGLLKPGNLIVGADNQVRILDLGISTLLTNTELINTMASAKLTGDLDCSSPESIMDPAKQSPASDRYSLGCVLYFMLSGHYPFEEGGNRDKIMAHQVKKARPIQEWNPKVPADLAVVVETLMEKTPEARYTNTADVVEVLRPLADASASAPDIKVMPQGGGQEDPAPLLLPETPSAVEDAPAHTPASQSTETAQTRAPHQPDETNPVMTWVFVLLALGLIGLTVCVIFGGPPRLW